MSMGLLLTVIIVLGLIGLFAVAAAEIVIRRQKQEDIWAKEEEAFSLERRGIYQNRRSGDTPHEYDWKS